MNRVQSGDMPSMGELMNDPALRDMYVFPHSLGEYHLIDLIERQNSVAEPMALGRGGARDHLAAFLIETITSTRCGGGQGQLYSIYLDQGWVYFRRDM